MLLSKLLKACTLQKNKSMGILNFFRNTGNHKIVEYISKGAIILDVRTKREYDSGSIKGSKHIPLQELHNHFTDLKKLNKSIVICCASGMRSGRATKLLNSNNIDAINGGGWQNLQRKIQ